jgi:hypothetical protein
MRFVLALAVGVGFACGAAAPNYYKRSITKQESCCAKLADPGARQQCETDIRRADSEAVAQSQTNQETYRCVDRYFVCDTSTGKETRESAQAQLDCLNDLEGGAQ